MKRKAVKVITKVWLAPAQRRALAKLSAQLDVSSGQIIREGIALVLARYAKKGGR